MKNKRNKLLIIILSCILCILAICFCFKTAPFLSSLNNEEYQIKLEQYIIDKGWKGWAILLVVQVLQIFIAFIPGEIVEIVAGLLYGPISGLFICLLGLLIGSILIYYAVKLFANKYLEIYKSKLKTYSFLNNPQKIYLYLFILFLIPGIPKDIFIYLAPFLPIEFVSFLIISMFARIPSILSSTIIGNSLMEGNYLISIIIFLAFAIIGILGILFKDKLMSLFKKHDKSDANNINHNMEN